MRTIIVRDLSRFSRDYLEAGHFLEFVFPAYDVRFISINDGFDSENLGEITGGLELAVHNLINTMYSKDLSRKIKSAVDIKKLDGEYVYGTAPYGYKKGEKKNTIIIDNEAAPIVKRIFMLAAQGCTITQIARRMNEEKIPTPSAHLAKYRSKKYKVHPFWTFESIRNILANRIYTGDTVPFKSRVVKVGSDKVKMIPEEQWLIIPNTHEAIISRDLYYQAKTTIRSVKKSRRAATYRNPFTSLLVCGCCGKKLQKGKRQNKDWLCTSARYYTGLGCKDIRINDAVLYNIVLRAIVIQCQLLDGKIKQLSEKTKAFKSRQELLEDELTACKRQITRLQANKMDLYESYVSGKISKEDYISYKSRDSRKEEDLKTRSAVLKQQLRKNAEETKKNSGIAEQSKRIVQYQNIKELTPALTKELIKQITIHPNQVIRIEWNYADELNTLLNSKQ